MGHHLLRLKRFRKEWMRGIKSLIPSLYNFLETSKWRYQIGNWLHKSGAQKDNGL
jgi:hypothetical protein